MTGGNFSQPTCSLEHLGAIVTFRVVVIAVDVNVPVEILVDVAARIMDFPVVQRYAGKEIRNEDSLRFRPR